MEDGAFFGEITVVTEEKMHIASVVATSICELYRLSRKDFELCIQPYESILEPLISVADSRKEEIEMLEAL